MFLEEPPAAAPPSAPAWSYTVSVRELCEFTAKRGDLDRRFTPSATALEGLMGQSTVAQRRGPDYETEIALQTTCGPLRVRGRADGYDPRRRCLEEIKTIRGHPDEIPENRRQLHWAQLQTYGALFCRARRLVRDRAGTGVLRCREPSRGRTAAVVWRRGTGRRALEALRGLPGLGPAGSWPPSRPRPCADRTGVSRGRRFAPDSVTWPKRSTARPPVGAACWPRRRQGIGKTVGTLFPCCGPCRCTGIDKVAYLTCKGTGRLTALEALSDLRAGPPASRCVC
jgi:DNA excision repair protein ERCC-2